MVITGTTGFLGCYIVSGLATAGKPRRKTQARRQVESVLIQVAGLVQRMAAVRSSGVGMKTIS